MRIGIFGGTFDPIHAGHLLIAETARSDCTLDKILFIPAADPPHKDFESVSSAELRLMMVRAAVAENPFFEAVDVEIQRGGVSYTIDTVRTLKQLNQWGGAELFLIIGGDSLVDLNSWKDPEGLMEEIQILVAGRPGFNLQDVEERYRTGTRLLDTPLMAISASTIRQRVREGRSIRYWVPDSVADFIEQEGLYR